MYNLIIRPLLFCIDPEKVHRMLLSWLKFYRYLFPVRACVRGYSRVSDPFSYGHLQFNLPINQIMNTKRLLKKYLR